MTESVFDLTRRGYDRAQVDDRLRALSERAATAERARDQESELVQRLESELATLRVKAGAVMSKPADEVPAPAARDEVWEGFGVRAEKILRLAEDLAAQWRSEAADEVVAMREQARADIEKHRQEVEQALAARAVQQDREAGRRQGELHEREQHMARQLDGARQAVEEMQVAARREVEQLGEQARERAAELLVVAEEEMSRRQSEADLELARVRTLRDEVRAEIVRLHELLRVEVDASTHFDSVQRNEMTSDGESVARMSSDSGEVPELVRAASDRYRPVLRADTDEFELPPEDASRQRPRPSKRIVL